MQTIVLIRWMNNSSCGELSQFFFFRIDIYISTVQSARVMKRNNEQIYITLALSTRLARYRCEYHIALLSEREVIRNHY